MRTPEQIEREWQDAIEGNRLPPPPLIKFYIVTKEETPESKARSKAWKKGLKRYNEVTRRSR